MPRVHTARAAKDYPEHGIKRGETYYHWSFFRGPKMMSATPPRQSQITGSANLSQAYAVGEGLEDALSAATCPEDVCSALDDAISAAAEAREAYEETISNLEESFQGGCPALDDANEKRDALEAYESELENAKSEIEQLDAKDYLPEGNDSDEATWDDLNDEGKASMLEAAREIANGVSLEI